jgi:putative ABC transport system ATP-binding protein
LAPPAPAAHHVDSDEPELPAVDAFRPDDGCAVDNVRLGMRFGRKDRDVADAVFDPRLRHIHNRGARNNADNVPCHGFSDFPCRRTGHCKVVRHVDDQIPDRGRGAEALPNMWNGRHVNYPARVQNKVSRPSRINGNQGRCGGGWLTQIMVVPSAAVGNKNRALNQAPEPNHIGRSAMVRIGSWLKPVLLLAKPTSRVRPVPPAGSWPAGAAVFAARKLTKTYRIGELEVPALRHVDLEIGPGEFIVILGPSGSGKSTLLNILGGLDTPSSGEALFRDHILSGATEAELTRYRREHVGFVFQAYNLIPSLTARENVALVTEIAVNPMAPEEALGRVGLADRMDHFPAQLSGGEQQRVAIARAIAKRPDVLLCDEPTGALDCQTGITVLRAILDSNRQLGATAIVITHNAAIAGMADRVLYLADGVIARIERNTERREPEEIAW